MPSVMIQFSSLLIPYVKKTIIVWKTLYSKNGIFLAAPMVAIFLKMSTTQQAGWFLGFLMAFDAFTGILVSMKKRSKIDKEYAKLFILKRFVSIISSEKLKRSGVKFLLYSSTILMAFLLQFIFKIIPFDLPLTELKFSLTLIVILFWIATEIYSILFENFKELGFDIKKIIKDLWGLKTEIKKDTQ